jgi:hypothetical protein
MAFIREYGLASDMGDPFSFRIPKRVRKMRLGRSLKGLARLALPAAAAFVPGGPAALGFARAFGLDVGDPSSRRKSAGAGPKAKAAKKAKKRGHPLKAKKPSHGKGKGVDWNKIAESATSLLPVGADLAKTAMEQFGVTHGDDEEAALQAQLGGIAGTAGGLHPSVRHALGMGHRRRSMNPANVKALRRSIRRLEGFERVVKSVYRAFPRLKPHTQSARGGHRAGCGCVACRKRK